MEWLLYGFLALWGVLFLYLSDKNKSKTPHKNNDDFDFQKTEKTFDEINPATGKIMLDGSGVDTSGNPYGFDHRNFNENSSCRDEFLDNHWNRYD